MKLQKTTARVLCGTMALVMATVSAAAATADSLPPMSEYGILSDPAQLQQKLLSQADAAKQQEESEEQDEKQYLGKKSETVYVNLHADGSVRDTIVTDWLHSDSKGAELPDRTDLEDITNVKGTETPQENGDELTWNLKEKDLYYRGKSDKPLPLEVSIHYALDGKELSPEEIAGKSGKLEMTLQFKNTTSNPVIIAGKQTDMQTPLMVIAGMSLSSDYFTNVEVSDGTVVSDGNNQVISIVCMPGLEKSLDIGSYSLKEINDMDFPEEFTVTADVDEFEMGPIGIAVTSELPNLDDIKKSDDIDDMREDLYDLQDMQDDLNRADPDRDLRSLITDPDRTEASQLLIDDIFTFYDLNKDILDILPKYITDDNIKLYDRIKYDMKDSTLDTLLDDEVVFDLLHLVDEISPAKMQSLADDFENIDLEALRTLMDRCNELSAVFGTADTQEHIATLKKLAACRKPMFALLGDMDSLDDEAIGSLMMSSIVAQIPGTGTIPANVQGLLTILLGDSDLIKQDMADGYKTSNPNPKTLKSAVPDLEDKEQAPKKEDPDQSDLTDSDTTKPDDSKTQPTNPEDDKQAGEPIDGTKPVNESTDENPDDSDKADETDEKLEDSKPDDAVEDEPVKTDEPKTQPDVTSPANESAEDDTDDVTDSQNNEDSAKEEMHTETLAAYVDKVDAPQITEPSEPDTASADVKPQEELTPAKAVETEPKTITEEVQNEEPEKVSNDEVVVKRSASADDTPREQINDALSPLFKGKALDETCAKLEKFEQFKPLVDLRNFSKAYNNNLSKEDDVKGAIEFADSMLTTMETLELNKLVEACFAPLVKNVKDTDKKAEIIREAMNELTEDLLTNKENFTSLILLMDKLKEEDLLDDIEYIDDLRRDMQDLRPIVKSLNRDLDKNYINISLHESPETTDVMLKMKDDMETHRDISESLRTAMLPKNIDIGRSMIDTLDRLETKDAVGDSLDKMDDADELLDRKEALVDLSDQYQIFTDAPEELETELKFIMKTDEIEAPEQETEDAPPEEEKGFFAWCKDIIQNVTGK